MKRAVWNEKNDQDTEKKAQLQRSKEKLEKQLIFYIIAKILYKKTEEITSITPFMSFVAPKFSNQFWNFDGNRPHVNS